MLSSRQGYALSLEAFHATRRSMHDTYFHSCRISGNRRSDFAARSDFRLIRVREVKHPRVSSSKPPRSEDPGLCLDTMGEFTRETFRGGQLEINEGHCIK